MMTPELKAKWMAALKSGEYEQGRGALMRWGRHCCLGVLCEVAGETFDGEAPYPTDDQLARLGLDMEMCKNFVALNDGDEYTDPIGFDQIAKVIGGDE